MSSERQIGQMMTMREVSELLHIHINTVRRWSDEGLIRYYRVSRRGDRRFRKEDIARFLAELNHDREAFRSGKQFARGEDHI